jgi:hypothetical protein
MNRDMLACCVSVFAAPAFLVGTVCAGNRGYLLLDEAIMIYFKE